MKDERPLVKQDLFFAKRLDDNCKTCQGKIPPDNSDQLATLAIRQKRPVSRVEKRILKELVTSCKYCQSNGGQYIDSITATKSCLWRI